MVRLSLTMEMAPLTWLLILTTPLQVLRFLRRIQLLQLRRGTHQPVHLLKEGAEQSQLKQHLARLLMLSLEIQGQHQKR